MRQIDKVHSWKLTYIIESVGSCPRQIKWVSILIIAKRLYNQLDMRHEKHMTKLQIIEQKLLSRLNTRKI